MHPLAFLEVYMIRVMVNGAGGKMGREVVKAVHNDPELTLVGGIDPTKAGCRLRSRHRTIRNYNECLRR